MQSQDFKSRWEARLVAYRTGKALVDGVSICELVLAEFAEFEQARGDTLVTIGDGMRLTGRSRSTFERWLKHGRLKNHGSPRAPRIRLGDLTPALVKPVEAASHAPYHASTDARVLATRLTGGHHAS